MDDNKAKEKIKTQDILIEIDNLKKYIGGLASNVNSDQLESYINVIDKDITKLQDETEIFFNNKYDSKLINEIDQNN